MKSIRNPIHPFIPALLLMALVFAPASAPAKEGVVQCGNLIYGGGKTSTCFSDEFLSAVQKETSISTDRRFRPVKLAGDELFEFPFVVMTGEGDFSLTPKERENLKRFLTNGGFLLASAGCSNAEWNASFRREMKTIFGSEPLKKLGMDHAIFHTVYPVNDLGLKKSDGHSALEGMEHEGRVVCLYSPDGLNNTANAPGCCCCGGNEIANSLQLNVNILAYALLH
jgi:hypothetical protein